MVLLVRETSNFNIISTLFKEGLINRIIVLLPLNFRLLVPIETYILLLRLWKLVLVYGLTEKVIKAKPSWRNRIMFYLKGF